MVRMFNLKSHRYWLGPIQIRACADGEEHGLLCFPVCAVHFVKGSDATEACTRAAEI